MKNFFDFKRQSVRKLKTYLKVLSSVKPVIKTDILQNIFTKLLSLPPGCDQSVQESSLNCLMTLRLSPLTTYRKQLLPFAQEHDFKDEVLKFPMEQLSKAQREMIIPIMIRMLTAKLLKAKGKSGREMSSKRNMVFMFFGKLNREEVECFLNVIVERYGFKISDSIDFIRMRLAQHDFPSLQSFTFTFETVIKQLCDLVEPYIPHLSKILLCVLDLSI